MARKGLDDFELQMGIGCMLACLGGAFGFGLGLMFLTIPQAIGAGILSLIAFGIIGILFGILISK